MKFSSYMVMGLACLMTMASASADAGHRASRQSQGCESASECCPPKTGRHFFSKHKCKECPWTSPGDMHQHYPYQAHPWTYYYFRPYNYTHIEQHQQLAAQWGIDPQMPYSNSIFERVYRNFELDPPFVPYGPQPEN